MFGQFILPDIEFEDWVGSFVFRDPVFHGSVGFVGLVVNLEIVDLKENAHLVARAKVGVKFGADFYITQNELAEADVMRRDALNLIREN